jgi:hypothetical protein
MASGQFGKAQACLGREQQQDVIAASEPGSSIWRRKDSLDLISLQEIHLTLVVALGWYREDASYKGAVSGFLEGHERKKERMVVRRILRVLIGEPRFVSRSSRKALMKGAARSSSARSDGGLRSRDRAYVNNSRNVSL